MPKPKKAARSKWKMIKNPIPWPGGANVAANYTFDMDADSILHIAHPDDAATRVSTMSYLRYGPEVAVPRICDMFEAYGVPVTFFVPGWCVEEHPKAIERMLKGGHEVAHHGYMHELANLSTRDREYYWTQRTFEVIERVTGKKPRGIRQPWAAYSKHSSEILTELGIKYDSSLLADDVPYIIRARSGRELVELPINWPMDDWPHYVHNADLDYLMPIKSPREATEVYMSEFHAMWRAKGYWEACWHPFVSGRPARMEYIAQMIEEMQGMGKVWFCTMEDCAKHVRKLVDQGKYKPRIDELPYKESRISQLAEDAIPLRG
jgi:peptidoglycan/xylan/chitin deacetylase (PgdA/CDA1 family)